MLEQEQHGQICTLGTSVWQLYRRQSEAESEEANSEATATVQEKGVKKDVD